ncbi:hypothetical protein [Sulfobacillus harzensis]|uniref:Uncharacterized protein n=1 Tax=Sulfobacillus harzensis TaxID=2729629 RepID=A0A7Y0Q342_9FIRM|nr:hypothetical protein [Sulfobacillus harzensis]NMP21814.1 hypothetical protein [Sulfobacillus harzensis]
MKWWASALAGAGLVLAVEAATIYGIGVQTTVPKSQAVAASHALANALDARWPSLEGPMMTTIRPIMRRQIGQIVGRTSIDIGGVPVRLPPSVRQVVADKMQQVLEANLSRYLRYRFRPSQFLTPRLVEKVLERPVKLRLWVNVGRIPIPVTIEMK